MGSDLWDLKDHSKSCAPSIHLTRSITQNIFLIELAEHSAKNIYMLINDHQRPYVLISTYSMAKWGRSIYSNAKNIRFENYQSLKVQKFARKIPTKLMKLRIQWIIISNISVKSRSTLILVGVSSLEDGPKPRKLKSKIVACIPQQWPSGNEKQAWRNEQREKLMESENECIGQMRAGFVLLSEEMISLRGGIYSASNQIISYK